MSQARVNVFPIEGTSNANKEQLSGDYMDRATWPDWERTLIGFKELLIARSEDEQPFSVLRLSHSEQRAFSAWKNSKLFTHRAGTRVPVSLPMFCQMCESVVSANCVSTQLAEGAPAAQCRFAGYVAWIMGCVDAYLSARDSQDIARLQDKTQVGARPCLPIRQTVPVPMDMLYGLVANRWLTRTFRNRVGLIGAGPKLDAIKQLMEHHEYRDYLGTDCFTDYVPVQQNDILNLPIQAVREQVADGVRHSTCDVFLVGAGVGKLLFFDLLKELRGCVFIDVGHGIDMLAGYGDTSRPYSAGWINYGLRSINDETVNRMGRRGPVVWLA